MTAMDKHEQAYTYCAYCPKLCRFSCPVSEATHTESHSTWGKMTAAHLVSTEKRALDESTAKALHACTGCGRLCLHLPPIICFCSLHRLFGARRSGFSAYRSLLGMLEVRALDLLAALAIRNSRLIRIQRTNSRRS